MFWRVPWKCSQNVGFGPIPWGGGVGNTGHGTIYIYIYIYIAACISSFVFWNLGLISLVKKAVVQVIQSDVFIPMLDSKRPFITKRWRSVNLWKGHLSIPKRSPAELPGWEAICSSIDPRGEQDIQTTTNPCRSAGYLWSSTQQEISVRKHESGQITATSHKFSPHKVVDEGISAYFTEF